MQTWKTLSRETLLDCGKFLRVENHVVELPDGRIINDWPWLIIPDYINVVAIAPDNKFLCFRQVKYAVDGTSLAVVGGYIEPGEDPLDAAKRELLEETGYEASKWISLGGYSVDANRGAGKGNFFLALDATKVTDRHADDLEEQELLFLSRSEVIESLKAGEFKVIAWSAIVAMALVHLSVME